MSPNCFHITLGNAKKPFIFLGKDYTISIENARLIR